MKVFAYTWVHTCVSLCGDIWDQKVQIISGLQCVLGNRNSFLWIGVFFYYFFHLSIIIQLSSSGSWDELEPIKAVTGCELGYKFCTFYWLLSPVVTQKRKLKSKKKKTSIKLLSINMLLSTTHSTQATAVSFCRYMTDMHKRSYSAHTRNNLTNRWCCDLALALVEQYDL